jgi:hypothetical protein
MRYAGDESLQAKAVELEAVKATLKEHPMLFVRMVLLPFFVALALQLVVSFLLAFAGHPAGELNDFQRAALLIPLALMISGYFGVKTIVQEITRASDAP